MREAIDLVMVYNVTPFDPADWAAAQYNHVDIDAVLQRVNVEPIRNLRRRPRQRHRFHSSFDRRILIRSNGRNAVGALEVPDPEARDRTQPHARIRQHSHHGFITGVPRGLDDGFDLVHRQQLIRIDRPIRARPNRNRFRPLNP